jgi:hypothetical protein
MPFSDLRRLKGLIHLLWLKLTSTLGLDKMNNIQRNPDKRINKRECRI